MRAGITFAQWWPDLKLTPNNLKHRTLRSFAWLGLGTILFIGVWKWIAFEPEGTELSPAFRQVLELNGKLWKKLYRPNAKNVCKAPPAGQLPRVNGDIGISETIDVAQWTVEFRADDQDPAAPSVALNLKQIMALPRVDTALNFRCVEGWSEDMAFAGVRFADFVRASGFKPKAYVGLVSVDGQYYVSVDTESMMHDQTLLAYEMNGRPLLPANGSPLRLVIPTKYGIKNLKQIGKIFFSDRRPPDYWAEQDYDWFAGL